ncbi:MAG TPA: amidohydrolase family protein [Chloroflexota bacterium]|nr:amidohydrolase family protein [Chloroflexota bacterium]
MIIDLDSHLRENYFMDEMFKLDEPFAEFTPERIVDGPPPQRKFRSRIPPGPSGTHGYNHSYMYDPTAGWRGGEIAARQVTGWDMAERAEANTLEGLDKQLIFPTGIWAPTMTEGPLGAALARAYNNWVTEFVKDFREQFLPVALMPAGHPEAMPGELRRCVTELGLKAAHLVCYNGDRNLDDPSFFPFYETAQELDVPLFCHPNGQQGFITQRFDKGPANNFLAMHTLGRPTNCTQALVALVAGGVFERFPRLKVVFFECTAEWPLYWMHRMDDDWEWIKEDQERHMPIPLTMPPSEYVKRNCYVTMEADEHASVLAVSLNEIGAEHIMMATDMPHFDSEFPHTVSTIKERRDLTPTQKELILGENARKLLNL